MIDRIDFNNEHGLRAAEINNVWPDWVLPTKLDPRQPLGAQLRPENAFGRRLIPPEFAGSVGVV